jgi:hypothetical protein
MNRANQSSEPERPVAPTPDEARSAAGVAVDVGDEGARSAVENGSKSSALTHKSTQGGKFRVAYGILGTLATLAVVAFAILLVRGGPEDIPLWSTFQPTAEGLGTAEEVAAFVESRYVFEDGTPMVSVSADWLTLQDAPIEYVSIERPDSNGRTDELLLPVTSSVKFGLCGDGEQCSITRGEASPERLRYLSRASLELALHTFQYMPEVESVVTYLPPPVGTQPTWALFFQRDDFAWALDAPLSELMELTPPQTPALMVPAEATLIDELTTPIQFRYSFYETNLDETVLGLSSETPG